MRKIFLIAIILFLNSCGYSPLYSSKDTNYKVITLKKNVNNNLTDYIHNRIQAFSNDDADKSLNISFDYNENITVILKNSKGDPVKNRFSENFEYNIDDNKFNLKQYEKKIKFNLVEDITQQILIFLVNVK